MIPKRSNLLFALLILALLTSLSSADALLQIANYTTTPNPVYAGTVGYLQVTIKNAGDATATSVSAYYNINGVGGSIPLGDLTVGSTVPVTVPFKIDPSSAGGIQIIGVDIYYYGTSSSTSTTSGQTTVTTSKKVSLQIPLQVVQPNPLEVSTLSFSKPVISPGESFSVVLAVRNTGGQANNIVITTPSNSSFSLDGISEKVIGTIPPNSSQNISIDLISSSATSLGSYTVPLVFTYYDRLNTPASVTFSIGPLSVQSSSTQYRLDIQTPGTVEIGSQTALHLTLSNSGNRPISAIVDLNSSDVFTPLDAQRVYFDSIASGSSASQDVLVGVSATASAGYYPLTFVITPNTGSAFTQSYGIVVKATPSLSISLDQSGTPAEVLIANTGNSQVRSVDVTIAAKNQPQGAVVQNFVGTLNVDDYSTIPLTSLSASTLEVTVTFRDTTNQEHTITQELDTTTGASSFGNSTQGSAFSRNGTRGGAGGGGLLGGIFGGAQPGAAGIPLPLIIAGVVVLAIIAFLVWRHFKGKKPKTPAAIMVETKEASTGKSRKA